MIDTAVVSKLYRKNCKIGFAYSYGTAGFRYNHRDLDTAMFTTGILAALRSMYLQGKYIGVMITASHNPPQDNGVKIVDPMGEMLDRSWELFATELANSASQGEVQFITKLNEVIDILKLDGNTDAKLAIARDSRESGPRLLSILKEGCHCLKNVTIIDYDLLTTPQLHFLVYKCNMGFTRVYEDTYYKEFSSAWFELCDLHNILAFPCPLIIDSANGIGAPKARKMLSIGSFSNYNVKILNDAYNSPHLLNNRCGADFVKTNQCFPDGVLVKDSNSIYCSFDGDADRVIFYYCDELNKFRLLDGDKISLLFAKFFQSLLPVAQIENIIKLGVVQTAYANGSSTVYLSDVLKVPVSCVPTGVKYLHEEAVKKYDIGIYFEANGHGTIVFSDRFYQIIEEKLNSLDLTNEASIALKTLLLFSKLINQTVGDAISDMLGVLAILSILKMKPKDWDNEYHDLPNLLIKVTVPDRSIFKTIDAERKLVTPEGLQLQIDQVVSKFDKARSFVRASGTENVVRIYSEACTMDDAKKLSGEIGQLVTKSAELSSLLKNTV